MLSILQVLDVVLVAVAMALAVAYALELPSRILPGRETYRAVQPIYYPGFTIAGNAEPLAIISTIVLLFVTLLGSVGGQGGSMLMVSASGTAVKL